MKKPKGIEQHKCSPKDWRKTPMITGDYDMDATIMHNNNKDVPKRLALYTKKNSNAYGPRTAYNGYDGYSGDD